MAVTEDLLFAETDGGCANCGLRDSRVLTIHHLEQSKPKNENYDNKLVLCHNCHQCHHRGHEPTTEALKDIKRRLIIKTLTRPGLNALKQAYRHTYVVAIPFLVIHLLEQRYLKEEEIVSSVGNDEGTVTVADSVAYTITLEGRQLLEKWDLK
jgi:hypothetical protein